jgi:hypothetical protein
MIVTNLNLDQLRLRPGVAGGARRRQPPRHRPGELFLKGPIPWTWLTIAAKLPGKALHVGMAIWFLSGVKRSAKVKLPRNTLAELGISRYAARRALLALEKAGLVSVVRSTGVKAVITLKDIADPSSAN